MSDIACIAGPEKIEDRRGWWVELWLVVPEYGFGPSAPPP